MAVISVIICDACGAHTHGGGGSVPVLGCRIAKGEILVKRQAHTAEDRDVVEVASGLRKMELCDRCLSRFVGAIIDELGLIINEPESWHTNPVVETARAVLPGIIAEAQRKAIEADAEAAVEDTEVPLRAGGSGGKTSERAPVGKCPQCGKGWYAMMASCSCGFDGAAAPLIGGTG